MPSVGIRWNRRGRIGRWLLGALAAVVLAASAADAEPLKILAAENFYGDIARQIG
jgi:hypothetical protein